jgi:hypothetical protein
MVIDITNSPGRTVYRDTYVEGVGSSMWLTREFFRRTGADPQSVRKLDGVVVEPWSDGIKISAREIASFKESDGPQRDLQNALRESLFPGWQSQ